MFQMADSPLKIENEADGVEAGGAIDLVTGQVAGGSLFHSFQFAEGEGVLGHTPVCFDFRPHLDKDQRVSVAGEDVNIGMSDAAVPSLYSQSFSRKVFCGDSLSQLPQLNSGS